MKMLITLIYYMQLFVDGWLCLKWSNKCIDELIRKKDKLQSERFICKKTSGRKKTEALSPHYDITLMYPKFWGC